MKAELWKVWVVESALELAHGFARPMLEIHIPEMKFSVNETGYFELDEDDIKHRYQKNKLVMLEDEEESNMPKPEMLAEYDIVDDLVSHLEYLKKASQVQETVYEGLTELFAKEITEAEDNIDSGNTINIMNADVMNEISMLDQVFLE